MVKQFWLPKFLCSNYSRNGQMDVWSGVRGKIVVITEEERVRFTNERRNREHLNDNVFDCSISLVSYARRTNEITMNNTTGKITNMCSSS